MMAHVRDAVRQALLDQCAGKDVLMLGPLGRYDCYRDGGLRFWDFDYLTRTARSLVGLDLNEELAAVARADGFNVQTGNAEDFGGEYDIIYAPDLIEHLGNVGKCLDCCARVLRPGGRIIMETPNPIAVNVILKALITGDYVPLGEHTCWIDAHNARELARRSGLAVTVRTYTPLDPYGAGMWLRTFIYRLIGTVRPKLGMKLVFVFTRGVLEEGVDRAMRRITWGHIAGAALGTLIGLAACWLAWWSFR